MLPHSSLVTALYQIDAIQFGEFTLKSGQTSSIYINLRKIISYPDLLRKIANLLWETVKDHSYDLICGVPYTALPIATCISLDQNLPLILCRKEKKDYGMKQMVEGEFSKNQRCLIVEDVVTSGKSVLETVAELEKAGLIVEEVVALINRESAAQENLTSKYKLHTIFSLSDILTQLAHSSLLQSHERKIIENMLLERAPK